MPRRLSAHNQAYNKVLDALDLADRRLAQAAADRDAAWRAAEALHPIGRHGLYQGRRELTFKHTDQGLVVLYE